MTELFRKIWSFLTFENHPDTKYVVFKAPETFCMSVVRTNNLADLKGLLLRGELLPDGSYMPWHDNHPVLSFAVATNKREIVRLLLLYKANPNARDTLGTTPLMRAFGLGRMEIAKILLEAGGDPHLKDEQGNDCEAYAKMGFNFQMLALLGKGEAEPAEDYLD
jgi:ankyrin repeat protein